MSQSTHRSRLQPPGPPCNGYIIRVRAHFDCPLASWFGDLSVQNLGNGEAELTGCIPDQAALFGVLVRLRDLGIPLISINPAELKPRPRRRRTES